MKYYTKNDEWVLLEGPVATLGISRQGADELGDVTFVQLPQVGQRLQAGDVMATIESVKAAIDFYTPLAGTVTGVNAALTSQPETLTQDPEGQHWMIQLTLDSPISGPQDPHLKELLEPEAYRNLRGQ